MKYLKPIFRHIKKPVKKAKVYLKHKAGWIGIPKILPYRGFGDDKDVYITGMVIEDNGLAKPREKQRVWKNILAMIKRFFSDEIAGVSVKARFYEDSVTTKTDEMGFFSFHFQVNDKHTRLSAKEWHTVHFELADEVVDNQPDIFATGEVRIITPPQNRIFISDIDDTVLISYSTQIIRKLRLMLFKNALTRLPFPGISDFYRSLEKGKELKGSYPFFYVSSSEWNLYDLLDDFFHYNHIPKGVFLLRRLNNSIFKFWQSGSENHEHKYKKIRFLLDFYQHHQFVLIGDDGQRDPYIYGKLAKEYPGRIETIYIRQGGKGKKSESIRKVSAELADTDTSFITVNTTSEAVAHAESIGYVVSDPESSGLS